MKLLYMNFFSLLLILHTTSMVVDVAAIESTNIDNNQNVRNSCMSVALHDFYSIASNAPQASKRSCDYQSNDTGATSNGVLWLEGSTKISRDKLTSKKLRIGVPLKNGFQEFMRVDYEDQRTIATGFPIDVFEWTMKKLPYNVSYEFIPYKGDQDDPVYYDALISQVYYKVFDAVVGDTAITANRSDFVDFTYEYMEAGASLVVPTVDDDTMSAWWFMKPLTTDLWLTTLAFAVLKGILVWVFEHDENPEFQGASSEMVGKILSFSFSTFVFANSEKLQSNYSRFILNLWTFLVFVLVTAYAANLTSMLTVEKLQPTVTDVKTLIKNNEYVGYQNGSFVFELLKNLGFNESRLRSYSTVEQYAEALERGSGNNGVSAIMDEIPYIKVFLKNHCRRYTMVGPTYRTGGFGFVFPRGSAMVPDISRAVLNLTQGEKMLEIERKWFGDKTCLDSEAQVTSIRLPLYSLRSIYIISGVASAITVSIFFIRFLYRRRRCDALREALRANGLWMRILTIGRYFNRMGTTLGNPGVELGPETSAEFSIIGEELPDSCSIEMTQSHMNDEDDHDVIIPHALSLDTVYGKISRTRSRTTRNYSTRY
ncbi:glutamate receptor 2.8-like [Magnolia sinica]|uniref:glutamate receptor 2.8-like n=1 Tax=Magnolia sinica TaxID=86752 RepID=UPI00265AB7CA|nr:glutamate receptor 2.8-like [Magnolia sinica]